MITKGERHQCVLPSKSAVTYCQHGENQNETKQKELNLFVFTLLAP